MRESERWVHPGSDMNSTVDLRAQLRDVVRPGDHLCAIFDDPDHHLVVVAAYLIDGITRGECVLYAGDPTLTEPLLEALTAGGVDVTSERARGALRFAPAAATPACGVDASNGSAIRGMLTELLAAASNAGLRGARFVCEPTGLCALPHLVAPLLEGETRLNEFLPAHPAAGLCVYNRQVWPAAVIHAALRTHPMAIIGDRLCETNPFYERPDLLRDGGSEEERTEWMLARLQAAQQLGLELRAARDTAEAAHAGSTFLADANAALTAALDYQETLNGLARIAVPRLADWCTVDVVEADGAIRRVAVAHADPAKSDLARVVRNYPADPHGRHPRTGVLRTGKSWFAPQLNPAEVAGIGNDPEHRRVLLQIGYTSAMIVALAARGQTLGAMTLAMAESGRQYTQDDLGLAEDLAQRAALVVDNARLYRAAQQARAEAEAANRAKDYLLSTISHELRTPLSSILGWVAVLRQGKLTPEDGTRALETIERSGRMQAKLIDDLLDVSRIVAGRLRLDLHPVSLADIIEHALDTIRPMADEKGVRITVTLGPVAGAVSGDAMRLEQVVWNLLSNAVRFTPTGGQVNVRLEPAGTEAQVIVQDSGKGIAPDFLPRVFEPFRQGGQAASRREGGLGLGLAIVRHLVEQHGGRVTAHSDGEGKGATFTITLPVLSSPPTAPAEGGE
jgi:signal transduction histidine kinase